MISLVTAQERHHRQPQVKHLFQSMQYWKQLAGLTPELFRNIIISHYGWKPILVLRCYKLPQVNYALLQKIIIKLLCSAFIISVGHVF